MGRLLLLSIFLVSLSIQAQECPTIINPNQDFCDYVYDEEAKKVIQAKVSDLQADGSSEIFWFSLSNGGEPLSAEEALIDGGVYYAAYGDGTCTLRPSVTVRVDRQPVAGRTSTYYICSNSEPLEIYDMMPALTDGTGRTAEPGGTVSPALQGGGTLFDPGMEISGIKYKYTTPDSEYGICGPDDARITIHIVNAPFAGESGEAYFELDDEPRDLSDFLGSEANEGGKWTPELEGGVFDPEVNAAGIYTYTVTGERGCTASATIEVTLNTTSSTICHNGQSMLVNNNAVNGHLKHGDFRGSCEEAAAQATNTIISPNPSHGDFSFSNNAADIQKVRILNFKGGVEKEFQANGDPNLLEINLGQLKKGIYFAEVFTTNGKEVLRLVKK